MLFTFVLLLLPGLLGLLMLYLVGSHLLEGLRFVARATRVQGQVIAVSEEQCSRKVTLSSGLTRTDTFPCYEPEVRYEHQGQTHSARLTSERSRERFAVGASVPLLIGGAEDEPRIRIHTPPHWGYWVVVVVGLSCVALTVFMEYRLLRGGPS